MKPEKNSLAGCVVEGIVLLLVLFGFFYIYLLLKGK